MCFCVFVFSIIPFVIVYVLCLAIKNHLLKIQFAKRQILHSDGLSISWSKRSARAVKTNYPSHKETEIFQVPLMSCDLRTASPLFHSVPA